MKCKRWMHDGTRAIVQVCTEMLGTIHGVALFEQAGRAGLGASRKRRTKGKKNFIRSVSQSDNATLDDKSTMQSWT